MISSRNEQRFRTLSEQRFSAAVQPGAQRACRSVRACPLEVVSGRRPHSASARRLSSRDARWTGAGRRFSAFG